jgi:hypothetical protein
VPNIFEIQVMQKERLYDLLTFKRDNAGNPNRGLTRMINRAKSGMSKEDIAYVEKLVEQNEEL